MGVVYSTHGKAGNVCMVQVVKSVGIYHLRVHEGSRRNDIEVDHIQNAQLKTGQRA
jgi:hypothetical protein